MAGNVLRMWFYQRPEPVSMPILREDYEELVERLKQLAMGNRGIPGYLLFKLSDQAAILVGVSELAALQCLDQAGAKVPEVDGAKLYLRTLPEPIEVRFHELGPFADLVEEMVDSDYEHPPQGCVMMPDSDGNSIFFRPDDVHFMLFNASYLERKAYKPQLDH
jgi:hypothetical protein